MFRRWVIATALTLGLAAHATTADGATAEGATADSARDSQIAELTERLDRTIEHLQAAQADTDKLKKLKFSGYLQARWEHAENSNDSVAVTSSGLKPANVERFYLRRARLKLTYDRSPTSQSVVYFDAGTDRDVLLLEAYVTLMDPWTPEHVHRLTIGQMNVPFGYEIERSSSVRELPERSFAENRLFPGERDRGIKLVDKWSGQFETTLGVFNGGGIKDADFPTLDPTAKKDWLARGRVMLGVVDGSVSWYQGTAVVPLSGPDAEVDRTRFGADLQAHYEVPSLGGGTLRGELYRGTNPNPDSLKALLTATSGSPRLLVPGANPSHLATDVLGWYVMWVQNAGDRWQAVVRYDAYDPNEDRAHDQFERLSLGANWFYDGLTRVSVSYDVPLTDGGAPAYDDPKDNLWTVQFQHKF